MTFAELRSHVLSAMADFLINTQGIRSIDADMAGSWVRLAQCKLDADLRWSRCRSYINAVAGQRYYTFPSTFHEILVVTYQGKPLERITSQDEIVRQDAVEQERGTPQMWAWWGPDLALYPQPDASAAAAIGMYVVTTPTALADGEEPTLPLHLQPLMLDYALSLGYRHVGEVEKAVGYMNLYSAAVETERYKVGNDRGTDNRISEDVI